MERNGEWDVLKPHPRQLEALVQSADGSSLREIGERMGGITSYAVGALLSGAYSRLKIRTKGERAGVSQERRWKAIKLCQSMGWLPEDLEYEIKPVPKRAKR